MYQSGWEAEEIASGVYGPYSQTGLIWANVASMTSAPKMKKNQAWPLSMKYGQNGCPTTFFSVFPLQRHLRVLLVEHDEQVRGDQAEDQAGDQQHVDDVHPRA